MPDLIPVDVEVRDKRLFCPQCGGEMNRSTKGSHYFCSQKNGDCGELILLPGGTVPKPIFHRTEVNIMDGGYGVRRLTRNNKWRRKPTLVIFMHQGKPYDYDILENRKQD